MDALVFDLDGTLLRYERPYEELLASTFESVVGDVREEWIETYNEAFFEHFRACTPEPVVRAAGQIDECTDPEAFAETLLQREIGAAESPENADADLDRLAETHALGVLTNGLPEWQRWKLESVGLASHFDAVVASYEAEAHKPDTAPYRLAERRLDASRYAMIGDAESDIDGALAAGWGTYAYDGGDFSALPDAVEWDGTGQSGQ